MPLGDILLRDDELRERFLSEEGLDAGHGRGAPLEQVRHPPDCDHRPDQANEVEVELNELAERDRPVPDLHATDSEDGDEREADQCLKQRLEDRGDSDELCACDDVAAVAGGHLVDLRLLAAVCPEHPQSDQMFLKPSGVVRQRLLGLAPTKMDPGPEKACDARDQRQRRQRQERERKVDARHEHRAHD